MDERERINAEHRHPENIRAELQQVRERITVGDNSAATREEYHALCEEHFASVATEQTIADA